MMRQRLATCSIALAVVSLLSVQHIGKAPLHVSSFQPGRPHLGNRPVAVRLDRGQVHVGSEDAAHADDVNDEHGILSNNRREALLKMAEVGFLAPLSWPLPPITECWAADTSASSTPIISQLQEQASSTKLEAGLLEARGTWRVASKTVDVQAPCGTTLFGGNYTYERARGEIGTTLLYDSRFIDNSNGQVVADREYNVQSISKAAMGQYSVMDIPVATPNKLTAVLAPKGSPQMLKVDLIALNRRQETISDIKFDCSEVLREIVAPVNGNNPNAASPQSSPSNNNAPILKEVETTSLYTFIPEKNEILCQQRSATFLLPSQTSPVAYQMWEAARGRPIDTRFYQVRYSKSLSGDRQSRI